MKKHKNIKTFSFITSEINTDEGDEIYLAKLNNIKLINSLEKEKDKKNKTTIIIIIVICGIIVIVGLSIGIFFVVKKVKSNKEKKNDAQIVEKANEVKENDRSQNIIFKN
jgi:predicted histidine transporter YuiF (NhaC family)